MEEPARKMLKLSNCLICNEDSQVSHFQAKYTEFVLNWFISSPEKELFCSQRYFDFCLRCIGLLEDLQGLRQGLDFILKNIREKEEEIKRKIAKSSKSSTDSDAKKFREFATKDLDPGVELSENNTLPEVVAPVSPSQTLIKFEPNEDIEIDDVGPTGSDFQNPAEFPQELTYSNFTESEENEEIISPECKVDIECFENDPISMFCSPSNGFDESKPHVSSPPVCKEEDVELEAEEIQSSHIQSFEEEEETVFPFQPWTQPKNDEDDTFEIISPEISASKTADDDDDYDPNNVSDSADSDDEADVVKTDAAKAEAAKKAMAVIIKAQMNEIVAKIVKPKTKPTKFWPKPPLNYTQLCILAIMTKNDMLMRLPDIYDFILDNFPYFKIRTEDWKDDVKDALVSKYFNQYRHDVNEEGELGNPSRITHKYTVSNFQIASLILEMISLMSFREFSSTMAYADNLDFFRSSLKRKIYPIYDSRYQKIANKSKSPKPTVPQTSSANPKSPKAPKESKVPEEYKEQKIPKVPKESKELKTPKESKESQAPIGACFLLISKKHILDKKNDTYDDKIYPPTPLSFKHLCVLGIMNTKFKLASAPDIFNFILENFPYFGNMELGQLSPYKRILVAVLKQSPFTLHSYWPNIDIESSRCNSPFEDNESYKLIYTFNDDDTWKYFRRDIATNIRSRKNMLSMRYPERSERFAQSVLQNVIVPNLPQYKKKYEKGKKENRSLR